MKTLREDIPTDRAWQEGRRLYVRCGYKSKLNTDMRAIGAKWDTEKHALWVGSTKKPQVLVCLDAAKARIDAITAVKDQGLWLDIPYEAAAIRDAAKQAGAVFDGPTKRWAFRDEESLDQITEARDKWITERDEKERLTREVDDRARREAEKADRERAEQAQRARVQRIVEESGRILTGDTTDLVEISTQIMNKVTAQDRAREIGSVVTLSDGRRGLVTAAKIWFTNDEMASSVCWHPETHDEAHWDFRYTVAVVEPTQEERDADADATAKRADAQEIHDLVREIDNSEVRAVDYWTVIPDDDQAGTIDITHGYTGAVAGGRVVLTTAGQVWWQHPGYYDDYIRTERVADDPELVARVRHVLDGGTRERVMPGQLPAYYRVTVRGA